MRTGAGFAGLLAASVAAAACSSGGGSGPAGDGGADGGTDTGTGADDGAGCDFDAGLPALFPQDRLVAIAVDFHDEGAFDEMVARAAADPTDLPFFPARVTFDGEAIEDVGVRLKGNSSLWGSAADQTKSLKLDFGEYVSGGHFRCVDKLNLHNGFMDPSLVRERLTYALAAEFGVEAPRTAHAVVTVDGARHGLFTVTEQIDAEFLEERFGTAGGADDGNLYKCEDGCPLAYWGDDPLYYQGYPPDGVPVPECTDPEEGCGLVLKTNEDDPAMNTYADIIALVSAIDGVLNGGQALESLDAVLDVEGFARFAALNVALSNLDSYFGSNHNFYLYRRPADGRFVFVMWDTNLSYGTFECPAQYAQAAGVIDADILVPCGPPPPPLADLLVQDGEMRGLYCAALGELMADLLSPGAQAARFEELRSLLDAARAEATALGQPPFGFSYDDFDTAFSDQADVAFGEKVIHALGYFSDARAAAVEAQLLEKCP